MTCQLPNPSNWGSTRSHSRAVSSQTRHTQRRLRLDRGVGVLLSSDLLASCPSPQSSGELRFSHTCTPDGCSSVKDGHSAHSWFSYLLPAQSSPNPCHLTPLLLNPGPWKLREPPQGSERACISVLRTALLLFPLGLSQCLSAGLKPPPVGSSPH